jgi:hypothetical protein
LISAWVVGGKLAPMPSGVRKAAIGVCL